MLRAWTCSSLLPLIPPSYMVAPNRELANKSFLNSSIHAIPPTNTNLPTVEPRNTTGMDISKGQNPDNYNDVRGRKPSRSPTGSKDTSMSSPASSDIYHERMEKNNEMDVDEDENSFPELSYKTPQEKELQLGKATKNNTNTRPPRGNLNVDAPTQHAFNNNPTSPPPQGSTVNNDENVFINIQLPYDPDAPTDPEIWNGGFHPISLHSSIEHIVSDAKNIKDSLKFMAKYIANKQIEPSKANNLMDFVGIGDAVWNFISSVYESNWDALHTNNKSNTLRRKIAAKFTPKIQPASKKPAKESTKSTPASIEKIPPPIPAKSQKEINIIFKNKQTETRNPGNSKTYAQASKQSTSTSDIIKIKDMFLSIGAKKIDQINEIIKGSPKPKHQINMTTKGPSRKQVIFPMSSDNRDKFMKNSAIHVANLNRNLKNTKSEVSVDFIRSDPAGITIVTNKVSQASDLTTIEKYVKNSENIDSSQVNMPRLPQSKSYLKIIGIPYFPNGNLQDHLNASDVETIIKQNHIFNNVTLASKPRVIKVSPKLDMAIVWIDIWDAQSGMKAKGLINRCFNVGSFIATIRGTNVNPGVPQCKNCWR